MPRWAEGLIIIVVGLVFTVGLMVYAKWSSRASPPPELAQQTVPAAPALAPAPAPAPAVRPDVSPAPAPIVPVPVTVVPAPGLPPAVVAPAPAPEPPGPLALGQAGPVSEAEARASGHAGTAFNTDPSPLYGTLGTPPGLAVPAAPGTSLGTAPGVTGPIGGAVVLGGGGLTGTVPGLVEVPSTFIAPGGVNPFTTGTGAQPGTVGTPSSPAGLAPGQPVPGRPEVAQPTFGLPGSPRIPAGTINPALIPDQRDPTGVLRQTQPGQVTPAEQLARAPNTLSDQIRAQTNTPGTTAPSGLTPGQLPVVTGPNTTAPTPGIIGGTTGAPIPGAATSGTPAQAPAGAVPVPAIPLVVPGAGGGAGGVVGPGGTPSSELAPGKGGAGPPTSVSTSSKQELALLEAAHKSLQALHNLRLRTDVPPAAAAAEMKRLNDVLQQLPPETRQEVRNYVAQGYARRLKAPSTEAEVPQKGASGADVGRSEAGREEPPPSDVKALNQRIAVLRQQLGVKPEPAAVNPRAEPPPNSREVPAASPREDRSETQGGVQPVNP